MAADVLQLQQYFSDLQKVANVANDIAASPGNIPSQADLNAASAAALTANASITGSTNIAGFLQGNTKGIPNAALIIGGLIVAFLVFGK